MENYDPGFISLDPGEVGKDFDAAMHINGDKYNRKIRRVGFLPLCRCGGFSRTPPLRGGVPRNLNNTHANGA